MPSIGDVLAGRYRIDGRLGAGGMATVWRARDLRLDRDVAVKVLLPNLAGDPAMTARFDREARSLAAISDPHVVAVFDVVDGDPATGREPFLVMELCPDGSLGALLDEAGSIAAADAIPLLADAAEGLAALHARGLVHRDVTPRNILLAGARARLGDLGLARVGPRSEAMLDLTPPGVTVGTAAYLAPEVRAGRAAGPAADVYGLGAVAYRALAGRPPGRDAEGAPGDARPRPIREAAPGVSEALASLVSSALRADPAARPSAATLAARLRELADAVPVAAAPPPSGPTATAVGRAGPAAPAVRAPAATAIAPTHVAPPPEPNSPAMPVLPSRTVPRASAAPGSSDAGRPPRPATAPPAPDPRRAARMPPPGPEYRGPSLWSGELVLVLVVVLVVVGIVVLVFGR